MLSVVFLEILAVVVVVVVMRSSLQNLPFPVLETEFIQP